MTQPKVAIFLADGFEEVEAMTPTDYLRRANIDVRIAGVGKREITGSRGVKVLADLDAAALPEDLDGVVLPGGMPGATNLAASGTVEEICRRVLNSGGLVAAICAAPAVALGSFGLLDGRQFTCYPGFEKQAPSGNFTPERVVTDGNLITSRGPGTAADFSLAIIRHLLDDEAADAVAKAALLL